VPRHGDLAIHSETTSRALWVGGVLLVLGALVVAVTTVDAGPGRAKARAVSATGAASLPDAMSGDAVLSASDMKPGARVTGTVTVANAGDATGAFRFAQTDVLDMPGAGGGRLSRALRLRVDDMRTGRRVYAGRLGAMEAQPLGFLRAGERATYRFTLKPPAAPDDGLAGSRVQTTFAWTADTREAPGDASPPTVVVQSPDQRLRGRTVQIALTCDERCAVASVSRGARAQPAQHLLPGRPTLQTVLLSRADARALRTSLEREDDVALVLEVTVADSDGNRTIRTVTVEVQR
jgi:hypothetical protein